MSPGRLRTRVRCAQCHIHGRKVATPEGLCAICAGLRKPPRRFDDEARHQARLEAKYDALRVLYVPKPARALVVAGVAYDVVWDGRVRVAEAERSS